MRFFDSPKPVTPPPQYPIGDPVPAPPPRPDPPPTSPTPGDPPQPPSGRGPGLATRSADFHHYSRACCSA